jgi:molybdate transport system substrate-binding protein
MTRHIAARTSQRCGCSGLRLREVAFVRIPAGGTASAVYPVATISSSKNKSVACAVVADVLSPAGQKVLAAAGF